MSHRILTTVVGSYPIPDWLAASPSEQALIDATTVVFRTQELAGIDLVADGELSRFDVNHPETNGMIDCFVRPLDNVRPPTRPDLSRWAERPDMAFRKEPAGVVTGPLGEGALNIPRDCARTRALTRSPLKFTVTSPYMLAKTLLDLHYDDLDALTFALADIIAGQIGQIDADVVQLDEANIPGSPDDAPLASAAINRVLDRVRTTPALHLCFGNYGGQSRQKGEWRALIGFLNDLHIDHAVIEMAFRGYDELAHFNELRPGIGIGLGVVDIKRTTVESADEIARRIERAVAVLGDGRIKYVNPDCGFWMLKRSIADAKIRALVEGRDLHESAGR